MKVQERTGNMKERSCKKEQGRRRKEQERYWKEQGRCTKEVGGKSNEGEGKNRKGVWKDREGVERIKKIFLKTSWVVEWADFGLFSDFRNSTSGAVKKKTILIWPDSLTYYTVYLEHGNIGIFFTWFQAQQEYLNNITNFFASSTLNLKCFTSHLY